MKIGVPLELKSQESRVGLTPDSVRTLVNSGHQIIIQDKAGIGTGFSNEDYQNSGAFIVYSAQDVYSDSDMIVKVKEPLDSELSLIQENQIVFTYFHLSTSSTLAEGLINSKSVCIAYETVTNDQGELPLLMPMSQVAGRMSVQAGAHALEKPQLGRGILLGGVPNIPSAKVLILGGGTVGENAAIIAIGMQAEVFIIDKSDEKLKELHRKFGTSITTLNSNNIDIGDYVKDCDLLIGAVLIPGAVPLTSTLALNKATLPFVLKLANQGYKYALLNDNHLLSGLNVYKGHITYDAIAESLGYESVDPLTILN
jgi:alanine dehydrogenase